MGEIAVVVVIILLCVIGVAAPYFIKSFMVKRAASQVIRVFRERGAMDVASAKSLDELGLRPKNRLQQMGRMRDYKQQALRALMEAEVVRTVGEDRLYLSETRLAQFQQ